MTTGPNPEAMNEDGDRPPAADPTAGLPPARVIRYGAMGYVGEFTERSGVEVACGRKVVVQTERGIELGEPLGVPCGGATCELKVPRRALQTYATNSGTEFCQPRSGRILRVATEDDVSEHHHLNANVAEDIKQCAGMIDELGLDMKIITAEHLLGGERIIFYFRSPARVDFRQLVKGLAHRYRTRIEMRQVGARDEARLVADYEVCGRECCCRGFLKKLRPVNMKMAKLQKSTLDPSKVSGRCGRLRCCLRYEHFGYEELAKRLPRVGSRVRIDLGPATVLDRQILTQLVLVRTDDNQQLAVPVDEIREFNLPPAPPKPPELTPAPRSPSPRRGAGPAVAPATPPADGPAAGSSPRSRRSRRRGRGGDLATPRRETEAAAPGAPAPERPPGIEPPTRFVAGAAADEKTIGAGPATPPSETSAVPSRVPAEEPATPDARPAHEEPEAGGEGPAHTGRRRRRGRQRRSRRPGGSPDGGTGGPTGGGPAP